MIWLKTQSAELLAFLLRILARLLRMLSWILQAAIVIFVLTAAVLETTRISKAVWTFVMWLVDGLTY